MNDHQNPSASLFSQFFADYGMVFVLLLLCAMFSATTYNEQHPTGEAAARRLAERIVAETGADGVVLIAARGHQDDALFADQLKAGLLSGGLSKIEVVKGGPRDARQALEDLAAANQRLDVVAGNQATAAWLVFANLATDFPQLGTPLLLQPGTYWWPDFLKSDNLLNVANQIAVIAIIAIGMTMVIITAGIDLSVGSLIALSAVTSTLLVREAAGAESAMAAGMTVACLGGIFLCGLMGLFSGTMVTVFAIPPFIVTLSMMLVASGVAYILSQGESVYQVPDSFVWLGRGADVFGIPNAVFLMLVLYAAAHVVMTRTILGRYIYAVGGNREAARLSGVPVRRVTLFVYTASGILAGLGGVVMASQLKSGSATYGLMYELYVIAAVVVGGTSLAGGEGKVLGTLIGAFIIAVIQNGMNLMNVESYTQKVVLGLVILVAVLLDKIKQGARLR
jgi:ribose transport system permease protein